MDVGLNVWLFALVELISAACLVHLWTRPALLRRKVLWSLIVPIPVAGPLAYGAFFGGPPKAHDSLSGPPLDSSGAG
jgi:hypothetical protein